MKLRLYILYTLYMLYTLYTLYTLYIYIYYYVTADKVIMSRASGRQKCEGVKGGRASRVLTAYVTGSC